MRTVIVALWLVTLLAVYSMPGQEQHSSVPVPVATPAVEKPQVDGCPKTYHGRALLRSVFRESDMQEPALVCFYAEVGMLKESAK